MLGCKMPDIMRPLIVKETLIENVKALPNRRSALALRARQPATPKNFPALAAVSLREERRPRPHSPQPPQQHPRQRKPAAFPQQRQYIACSASRKSRTMQPSIREQPASPSHSKQQVKKGAVIPEKGETDLNFRRYQPKNRVPCQAEIEV